MPSNTLVFAKRSLNLSKIYAGIGLFVAAVEGIFAFSIDNLLIFSGVVSIVDIVLFFLTKSTFKREEILTKWK